MKTIKNLKIRQKLYVLIGIALLGLLIMESMSLFQMKNLNNATNIIAQSWMPNLSTARSMNTAMSNIRLNETVVSTASANQDISSNLGYLEKEVNNMETLLDTYKNTLITKKDKELLNTLTECWKAYKELDAKILDFIDQGNQKAAHTTLSTEGVELYNAVNAAVSSMIEYNMEGSDLARKDSAHTYSTATTSMMLLLALIFVTGVITSFVVVKSIVNPIKQLEKATIEISNGNLDISIPYEAKDELGVLSNHFRELARKLKVIIHDEDAFLERLATGDFTVDTKYEAEYIGDFQPLLHSLRQISDRLNATILQISDSADRVAGGAENVSAGSQALSKGTLEQSSS
ncbi:MAG: MCP four helix bundle domain-containing protein, partial [Lachnospiraceae bacterium]|nr:MCP four helix bundle domain-containing protein [Lachnospiraceae bacterium]